MSGGIGSPWVRWMAGAAVALAYAFGSHALMVRAQESPWSLAVVLGPLVVVGVASLWRAGHRALAIGCVAVVVLVAARASGTAVPARWLYLAQHAGVHLALAIWFGSSLLGGREPLISIWAKKVHGSLTPAMEAYIRRVTLAWTLYFVAMAATSVVLFFWGDFAHWSLLANLLTPVFTVAMFVGEYVLRYRLHPDFERVSLQKAVQAYRGAVLPPSSGQPSTPDR